MSTRPRLLIFGSRGFVGANLACSMTPAFEVCDDAGVDITAPDDVRRRFESVSPEVVLLTAALSDIDRCEREKERAERVNVMGAVHVARECARRGARLLFTSSAAVFDGTRHGYHEGDPISPLSFYGQTKARAEAQIAAICPEAVVIRLALVLGRGRRPGTNSLLDKLAESFRDARPVAVPVDERRNPIDMRTLSQFLAALARHPSAAGTFHLGSRDSVSRYDLAKQLAQKMNCPLELVVPQTEPVAGRAPRGRDHFLKPDRIAKVCGIAIPTWEQVVERCLDATA